MTLVAAVVGFIVGMLVTLLAFTILPESRTRSYYDTISDKGGDKGRH